MVDAGGITLVILPEMKTAISIPDRIFDAAERLAKRLGISRSELYARAVARFVDEHRGDKVTEALDRMYAQLDSSLDPGLARLQSTSLSDDEW
jgi:antitoxin MazE6